MKWKCGPTAEQREDARKQWHSWFAWHPSRVGDGDCRWLETIERRGAYVLRYGDHSSFWEWEYREQK